MIREPRVWDRMPRPPPWGGRLEGSSGSGAAERRWGRLWWIAGSDDQRSGGCLGPDRIPLLLLRPFRYSNDAKGFTDVLFGNPRRRVF